MDNKYYEQLEWMHIDWEGDYGPGRSLILLHESDLTMMYLFYHSFLVLFFAFFEPFV